ncbi:MAG: hypothetical protein KF819_40305 [Labilithrix sp.]|nr:hypothetical protein [Labilithrix sp.]
MNTNSTKPASNDSIVDAVFDVGTTWAEHGLVVGRLALEASAKTLQSTAKLLDRVREAVARNPASAETPEEKAA